MNNELVIRKTVTEFHRTEPGIGNFNYEFPQRTRFPLFPHFEVGTTPHRSQIKTIDLTGSDFKDRLSNVNALVDDIDQTVLAQLKALVPAEKSIRKIILDANPPAICIAGSTAAERAYDELAVRIASALDLISLADIRLVIPTEH